MGKVEGERISEGRYPLLTFNVFWGLTFAEISWTASYILGEYTTSYTYTYIYIYIHIYVCMYISRRRVSSCSGRALIR